MSGIDWSKAPEGATHAAAGGWRCWADCWYKQDEHGNWFAYLMHQEDVWDKSSGPCGRQDLVQRPSPAWNGEGLPPASTVCELRCLPRGGWGAAEIKYMSHTMCVWLWLRDDGGEQIELAEAPCVTRMAFRPIRTPEQIAAESREAEILAIAEIICKDGAFDLEDPEVNASAKALYDAGYRKQADK